MRQYEQNGRKKLIATITTVIVISAVVITIDQLKTKAQVTANTEINSSTSSTAPTTTTTPLASSSPAAASTTASSYKDGTYSATKSYVVPHGDESIAVSLTLSNGVVTAASIKNSESDNDSAAYQEDFASSYKSHVVGKNINALHLDIIAGASDTTEGFNAAVNQIASQAKA